MNENSEDELPGPETLLEMSLIESHNLVIESSSSTLTEDNSDSSYKYDSSSRRIVNLQHLFLKFQEMNMHSPPTACTINDMTLIGETRKGLFSYFVFKCKVCNYEVKIPSEDRSDAYLDVTTAAVAATYEAGVGQSVLDTFLGVLNIPSVSSRTFAKRTSILNDVYPQVAENSMKEAAKLERELAVLEGRVCDDGTPWIYVTGDGAWCKRSYGTNYVSSGGIVSKNRCKWKIWINYFILALLFYPQLECVGKFL